MLLRLFIRNEFKSMEFFEIDETFIGAERVTTSTKTSNVKPAESEYCVYINTGTGEGNIIGADNDPGTYILTDNVSSFVNKPVATGTAAANQWEKLVRQSCRNPGVHRWK